MRPCLVATTLLQSLNKNERCGLKYRTKAETVHVWVAATCTENQRNPERKRYIRILQGMNE